MVAYAIVTPVAHTTGIRPNACAMLEESATYVSRYYRVKPGLHHTGELAHHALQGRIQLRQPLVYENERPHLDNPDIPVQQPTQASAQDERPERPREPEQDHRYAQAGQTDEQHRLPSNPVREPGPVEHGKRLGAKEEGLDESSVVSDAARVALSDVQLGDELRVIMSTGRVATMLWRRTWFMKGLGGRIERDSKREIPKGVLDAVGGHRLGQLEQHENADLQLRQRRRSASKFFVMWTLEECRLLVRRYLISWLGHDYHCCKECEPSHDCEPLAGDVRMPWSNALANNKRL